MRNPVRETAAVASLITGLRPQQRRVAALDTAREYGKARDPRAWPRVAGSIDVHEKRHGAYRGRDEKGPRLKSIRRVDQRSVGRFYDGDVPAIARNDFADDLGSSANDAEQPECRDAGEHEQERAHRSRHRRGQERDQEPLSIPERHLRHRERQGMRRRPCGHERYQLPRERNRDHDQHRERYLRGEQRAWISGRDAQNAVMLVGESP